MLMLEGLYYALLAMAVSTVLSVTLGPLIGAGCANVFWFFVYKFSVLPLAVLLPVFILLGLASRLSLIAARQDRALWNVCARTSKRHAVFISFPS